MLGGINSNECGMFRLGYSTAIFLERDYYQAFRNWFTSEFWVQSGQVDVLFARNVKIRTQRREFLPSKGRSKQTVKESAQIVLYKKKNP
jgi:hypothetical protein